MDLESKPAFWLFNSRDRRVSHWPAQTRRRRVPAFAGMTMVVEEMREWMYRGHALNPLTGAIHSHCCDAPARKAKIDGTFR